METEKRTRIVHTVRKDPGGLRGDCGAHITGRYNTGWLDLPLASDLPHFLPCPKCEALA